MKNRTYGGSSASSAHPARLIPRTRLVSGAGAGIFHMGPSRVTRPSLPMPTLGRQIIEAPGLVDLSLGETGPTTPKACISVISSA
jgi:hypothetical protein